MISSTLRYRKTVFRFFWMCFVVAISVACLSTLSCPAKSAGPKGPELELKTERAIVFKDGYGLIVKRGAGTTDARGEVYTDEVPDAAVLGSFWTTPKEGRLLNVVAGWREVSEEKERPVLCTETIEVLKANIGQSCSIQLSDDSSLSGVIREVLAQETSTPFSDAFRAAFAEPRQSGVGSVARNANRAPAPPSGTVSGINGTHFVLRTEHGDVLLSANEIRRLTIEEMKTTLDRKLTTKKRSKRLVFHFAKSAERRELLIAHFRPGLRWIPTYRINLAKEGQKKKMADMAMQAEMLNEAEDLINTPIDIVVGVPNFRFRSLPSPLILEQTLRNALNQAAPQLMGQFRNDLSNALFTQRSSEVRRDRVQPTAGQPETTIDLPAELTAAGAQEFFVYHLDELTLHKGERAAVPIFTAQAPYRDVYTWDVRVKRNDIATAPSGSGAASPLTLSKNEVWRQIELTNTTNVPWTTGAAMIMQANQPLAQELLTYTSPKGICRVPVTVAVDLRGHFSEQESKRQPNALNWDGYHYVKIHQRATLNLRNHKTEAVDVEITLRFGGKLDEVTHDGKVTLLPYRPEDWQQYRGSPAVNNSSMVQWKVTLAPGGVFQPTVHYHFYTRH